YLFTVHLLRPHSFTSFFFNATPTTEIYTLSLHDALPISARQRLSQIVLDQGQSQINAGGNTCGSPDVPIPDKDAFGVQLHPWIAPAERVACTPMRGGATPVQQTGFRQQEGAGTDTGDTPRPHLCQPADQFPDRGRRT